MSKQGLKVGGTSANSKKSSKTNGSATALVLESAAAPPASPSHAPAPLANTHGQALDLHCFAVGFLARQIVLAELGDPKLAHCAFISGCLHDIGKLDPVFQAWVLPGLTEIIDTSGEGVHIDSGKFTFEAHPRHNEVSLLLYHLMDDRSYKRINMATKDRIRHAIYWHHPQPLRKEKVADLGAIFSMLANGIGQAAIAELYAAALSHVEHVNNLARDYVGTDELVLEGFLPEFDADEVARLSSTSTGFPAYKNYRPRTVEFAEYRKQINSSTGDSLVRAALISADRLVSAISADELARRVEKKELLTLLALPAGPEPRLLHAIEECLSGFNERNFGSNRNVQQNAAAVQLASIASDSKVVVLKGPAGCGKTKIALEFAQITGAKKILWVCPRIQVCEGLFNDLMSSDYLAGATVEISTGARKEIAHGGFIRPTGEGETFSGDVVVTTIDQIVQSIVTHGNVTSLLAFLQAHVVFDEYHEYVGMEAFNLLFAELVLGKQLCAGENKSRTLLVSATPNFFYLDRILGIHPADVVGIDSFNKCPYVLNFEAFDEKAKDNSNPLYALQPANTIVISNTATTAQRSFIRNIQDENAILFHSKFKQADKTKLFNAILKSFGSNGTKEFDVLRSGPAVQAALNITANNMVTELTSAENWLQRLGRLNRFGEFTDTSVYLTAVPASVAEGKIGASAKFLTSLYSYRNACAWNAYLSAILISEAGVKTTGTKTIAEIYAIYEAFHSSKEGQKALELDLLDALAESVKVILARVHDPMAGSKPKGKSSELKLKAVSLRGDSLFVQMAVCQISPLGEGWLDGTYACSEEDSLTLGVSEIESYDPGGDQNLITFMHKNHHKILSFREKKKVAKAYKAVFLKYDAREASKPIYVSYVPKELRDCSTAQHEKARVYAVSDKQPIGVIEFSIINSSQNLVRNT